MDYIGVDLGTSAVKLLLVDGEGNIKGSCSKEYPIYFPKPGWSEQNPEDWYQAVMEGMKELLCGKDVANIAGIAVSGQMHGLVALDEDDEVIRPAILWNDSRSSKEVEYLNNAVGKDKLLTFTSNIAFAGFTAPKIMWMKNNEPELFAKIHKIMLPKDYINYRLTGVFATEYSDAAGMLLLDVKKKCWSKEMLEICEISEEMLPKLFESSEPIGELKPEIADELGLCGSVKVAGGAADNAGAAVGTGTVGDGRCNISLGTSGTIFIACDDFDEKCGTALHAFVHADGGYHLLGCILSAASCNKWFMEEILKEKDYNSLQKEILEEMLGTNHVYFLPYLMGERSPINDTNARGTFTGITMDTTRADMLLAVLEGVGFALKDCIEVAKRQGINIERSTICGGGAKSRLWLKIISNILNIKLDIVETEEGPGYGAAMLAATACGEYESVKACADRMVHIKETICPDEEIALRYDKQYQNYRKIYPAMKNLFAEINK